jgi:hypothetical protein
MNEPGLGLFLQGLFSLAARKAGGSIMEWLMLTARKNRQIAVGLLVDMAYKRIEAIYRKWVRSVAEYPVEQTQNTSRIRLWTAFALFFGLLLIAIFSAWLRYGADLLLTMAENGLSWCF